MSNAATAIVTGILGLIPGLIRKKQFCLWFWNSVKWEMKGGPFSSRQCRKTKSALVSIGMDAARFVILRKGVTPPDHGPKESK